MKSIVSIVGQWKVFFLPFPVFADWVNGITLSCSVNTEIIFILTSKHDVKF